MAETENGEGGREMTDDLDTRVVCVCFFFIALLLADLAAANRVRGASSVQRRLPGCDRALRRRRRRAVGGGAAEQRQAVGLARVRRVRREHVVHDHGHAGGGHDGAEQRQTVGGHLRQTNEERTVNAAGRIRAGFTGGGDVAIAPLPWTFFFLV